MIGLKFRLSASIWVAALAGFAATPPSFIYTETSRYDDSCADRFPSGANLHLVTGGRNRTLVPGFAASADAAVSFDGRRIVFAGKQKSGDSWQIWEAVIEGGNPRRITSFREDAITPFYATAERIVYARRTPTGFQIETLTLEGGAANRLSYAPGDHLVTEVLRDGRILYEGPHAGSPAVRDLFAVYADGSGVESIRCDHGRDRHAGVQSSSGDIVFVTGGKVARFTSAKAAQVELPAVQGEFAGRIAELAAGEWLAAFRVEPRRPYALVEWKPGQGVPTKILEANGAQAVQPIVIKAHEIPKRHPSALGDREGANLLCLNAYTSRSRIPAGAVATVRVWALDDAGAAIALGQAPVESDGSFFVQTPSERAIRFELLDKAGKIVAAEKGWFWARRGEQRICVGCHAGPERAPENAVPAVLLHNTEPVHLIPPAQTAKRGTK